MKRKTISFILTLVMVLSLMPVVPAYASGLTVGSGGTYSTLAAALSLAGDDDTINILSNVNEDAVYELDTTGKTITIDGGGYTITGVTDTTSAALKIKGTGIVKLENLTLQGGAAATGGSIGLEVSDSASVESYGTVNSYGGNTSDHGTSYGVVNHGTGTVNVTSATGGTSNYESCGVKNISAGTVNAANATGGSTGVNSYGVVNEGSGTVNVTNATAGAAPFYYSYGVINWDMGTVNVTNVSCGNAERGSTGVLNFSSGTVNATNVTGGTANTRDSYGVYSMGGGKINVTNATAGSAANGESYGAYAKTAGTVKVTNANYGTAVTSGAVYNDGTGTVETGGTYLSTLTLQKGTGASCVLDSITVAASGSTTIGTLPNVSKNGVAGAWYSDSATAITFSSTTVTGSTTLYSTFSNPPTLDFTSMVTTSSAIEHWDWNAGTKVLTLSGINLSTASSAGIIVPTDTAIVLVGDNHVESTQASGTSSSGIYAVNGLTISGSGTLTATGGAASNRSYGIYVDTGATVINSGTVTASGGTTSGFSNWSYGIYSKVGLLNINGGTVTASGGDSSGTSCGSYGLAGDNNGLTMNGGILNVSAGNVVGGASYGISFLGTVRFNGGTTTVTTNNVTNAGSVFGMNGIIFGTDQWISAPAGAYTTGSAYIVTSSGGLAPNATISPYIAPTISVNDSSVTEGDSGVTNLVFTVSLSAASVQTVTVNYATANGTATAGSDYSSTSGALSFSPGETSKTVNVVISGDATLEPNETIFLNLSSPTKATISDALGIGTITNDDAATIPLDSVSISGQAKVGQTLSATASPSAATVTYQWKAAGTNIATATGAAYTVQASDLSKTITVTVTGMGGYSGAVTSTPTSAVAYPLITTLTNNSFEIPALGATASQWWTNHITNTEPKKTAFGWKTTAPDQTFEVGGEWNIPGWGIQFIPDGRQFIELNANAQAAVYQDLNTTPGSVIYWSLYQGGVWYNDEVGGKTINNTMAVRIGSPEQLSTSAIMIQTTDTGYDQEWTTRTIYQNMTMTAMAAAPSAYSGKDSDKKQLYTLAQRWTKYEGIYEVPAGQTETRFAFASLSATPTQGNLLDGVVFRIANTAKAITAFNFNGLTPNVTGTINEGAKTIALTVSYGTDVTALVPIITYTGASISPNTAVAQNFTGPVTYTVTSETGATQAYTVTVTVASNGGGGGNHSSTPTVPANATVTVNGQSQDAGITTISKVGDKTVTTVTIDDKKIQEKIKEEGNQSTVSIPIGGSSDIGEGVLNGQTIKDMENKESILEIKTNSITYTLPASEISIDSVSSQFGQTVDLKDIKISVKIAEPSADTTKIVQDTANKNNYQVVVKPVDFEITCTSGSKTVSVSKFNGYVERMVAIPDGIDPSKVTTGIVLNNDGTFSHVPTTIVKIDGKYYAKINSLTNSTYSVIYNPIEFADAEKHWAKDSINEMGSRLVISGVGENKFEPNRDITRAEFAAIMVRALGLAPDTAKTSFSDVADSKWYSGYVGTAAFYGIIGGYDTDTFAPNDKITREQAMTMVARAMAITDLDATTTSLNAGTPLTGYTDTSKMSGYAKAGIIACLNTGVVTGKTADTIAPKKNITRAEVAVIIERLLKKSKLI